MPLSVVLAGSSFNLKATPEFKEFADAWKSMYLAETWFLMTLESDAYLHFDAARKICHEALAAFMERYFVPGRIG